ncbi:hypothetical protein [Sphingomonas sp. G-3-2-10]|uniref:hypothetical protein n=1 Tax=Sphingomonas sp. G-3-2-10 TaxID=2728838 RepID=UPI00146F41F6|nr:hypothetical protein [Sphingomonas sp. G-3-2-10]NML05291.1 hypothetical protein [Sphingomonas sp. G-3-2-10]
MSIRTRRHIRRRADLPPVPYHRWIRPVATFVILLGIGVVVPAMYFRGAQWTGIAGGVLFAVIATALVEVVRSRKSSRKPRRKRPA